MLAKNLSMLALAVFFSSNMMAQEQDASTTSKDDRNVMLNAADANKPREIQIGLPSEDVNVYENGLPVVYSSNVHKLQAHWRSDASLANVGLLTPSESAITTGNIAYTVDANTHLGQKDFGGVLNYHTNHFGLQNFDARVSGSITDNWLYSASVYQNFDPGNFKLKFADYADRTQIYHFALTRLLGDKGKLTMVYKHARNNNPGNFANQAPFIYNGDGSISALEGFDPGLDSYVPKGGSMKYMDIMTGQMKTWNMDEGSNSFSNELAFVADYKLRDNLLWKLSAKYLDAPRANCVDFGGSTISNVTAADGYTRPDGSLYEGLVEGRRTWLHFGKVSSFLLTSELKKLTGSHQWRVGLNEWLYNLDYHSSSMQWMGSVEPYPEVLSRSGVTTYGYNELSPEYTKGYENKLALYFSDNWKITPKLNLYAGARLEYYRMSADQISTPRFANFHIGDFDTFSTDDAGNTIATPHSIHPATVTKDKLNYAATAQLTYNWTSNFGLTADATIATRFPRISDYAGTGPTQEQYNRVTIPLLRGGVFYRNNWVDVTSMVSYIAKSNNIDQQNLTRPGTSEGKTVLLIYDIQTLGWTTSAEFHPTSKFSMHALFTWQKPVYNNYNASVTFSNGETMGVNANNMIVKEIPQILIELDPKYQITDNLSAWLSFRYFGKTYANLQEALYFNGHWETFGGVNWTVNKHLSLGVSVVNFLNEKGAKGTINGTELVSKDDASAYAGTYMSGSYMRPFTLEFSASVKF